VLEEYTKDICPNIDDAKEVTESHSPIGRQCLLGVLTWEWTETVKLRQQLQGLFEIRGAKALRLGACCEVKAPVVPQAFKK